MSKTIAIIPARGGSKRLPKKNLLELNGESLLGRTIQYAQDNLDVLDEIIVSTDDPNIKKAAEDLGVKVLDRPGHLATDTASTVSVLQHALAELGPDVDTMVLLQVTNPLRPQSLLKDALKMYEEKHVDSLITVSPNHQKFGRIRDGKFVPYNYEMGQRSQDMEPLYYENGLLYICKDHVIRKGKILSEDHVTYIVEHPYASVDIDTESDLKYASLILKQYPNQ